MRRLLIDTATCNNECNALSNQANVLVLRRHALVGLFGLKPISEVHRADDGNRLIVTLAFELGTRTHGLDNARLLAARSSTFWRCLSGGAGTTVGHSSWETASS